MTKFNGKALDGFEAKTHLNEGYQGKSKPGESVPVSQLTPPTMLSSVTKPSDSGKTKS